MKTKKSFFQPVHRPYVHAYGGECISVYAKRDGFYNSDVATKTITINKQGDLDGDGQLTVTDVTSLVNAILGK